MVAFRIRGEFEGQALYEIDLPVEMPTVRLNAIKGATSLIATWHDVSIEETPDEPFTVFRVSEENEETFELALSSIE